MSSAQDSFALVPSGSSQSSSVTAFPQQGAVDWVALSQMQFSASIAVLGRLSSAGVEPLTVAVGQAICSRIPLGVHGEKVLSEAMAGLKSCSSFGDVVYFGVGVRHILRVLVNTSQGASLVALCAAISESHSTSTSALIMFEMAKRFGTPSELTPSFAQWEAIVKVCSSVFCHTTLGLRVDQLLRLGGFGHHLRLGEEVGHPEDMAEIISIIGNIAAGNLLEVSVIGGPACSWIAVFADYVLGLRVAVRGSDGEFLSMNFDGSSAKAQVLVEFGDTTQRDGIACLGRVFILRCGHDFVTRCFHRLGYVANEREPLMGGRVSWSTIFGDTFGRDAYDLLKLAPLKFESIPRVREKRSPFDRTRPTEELGNLGEAFVRLFATGAAFYAYFTTEVTRYRSTQEFIISAASHLSELAPLRETLLRAASMKDFDAMPLNTICHEYTSARDSLTACCQCAKHGSLKGIHGRYCLPAITEVCLYISYLTGRLLLEVPIDPRRSAVFKLYEGATLFGNYEDKHTLVEFEVRSRLFIQPSSMSYTVDYSMHPDLFLAYIFCEQFLCSKFLLFLTVFRPLS